jgi:mono/diheme cytochrome c family protein
MKRLGILCAALAWAGAVATAAGQLQHPSLLRNHPAINYSKAPATDPVAELDRKLQSGEVRLESRGRSGYLQSVLAALNVPVESQMLVFSKTSFQAPRINPHNPRAIFFNDTVAVGWVRDGDVLEFVGQDPAQGAVFYTLAQKGPEPPRFQRNDTCVACHASDATHYVPGMFVGSVFPAPDGTTQYGPAYTTDHRTPFEIRWGGWFVTGTHHAERHMGNAIAADSTNLAAMVTPETVHVTDLKGRFDMDGYPSPHSDLVALLVLEHQAKMLNLFTRIGWEARIGSKESGRSIETAAAELVDYLLFVDEAELPGPIAGTSAFASRFTAQGPRDRQGRSLRDLSLKDRLLEYPCSYLIYSAPFNAMPEAAKAAVYARLWQVLSGQETGDRYDRLTAADRRAILEILRETKTDLPAYFHGDALRDTP